MNVELSNPNFWLAGYGAALSTILGIRELRKSRRVVRVSHSQASRMTPIGPIEAIGVTVVNHGHRPVVIKMAGLMTIGGNQLVDPESPVFGPWSLPKRLEDGDSVDVYLERGRLRSRIADIRESRTGDRVLYAYARDTSNRLYKSALPLDFEDQILKA